MKYQSGFVLVMLRARQIEIDGLPIEMREFTLVEARADLAGDGDPSMTHFFLATNS